MVSILEFIFINMAIAVFLTGVLIGRFEKYLPAFVIKGYRYGSFAYRGPDASFLQIIEIPKSYYRHFYYLATVLNVSGWIYMFAGYYLQFSISSALKSILKVLVQSDQPSVSAMGAFIALSLLTIQCLKRLYETTCLQVFAKSSKMNLSHYAVGMIHYFGCTVAILGEAPLFCGDDRKQIIWWDTATTIFALPCLLIFLWACYEQFQSNCILVGLRKDKKGNLVTEDHGVPQGRWFNLVSSPHRMCELIMYTMLLILVPTKLFMCIYAWVIANQVQTALQAHDWYVKTFKNYPKERTAIVPYLL